MLGSTIAELLATGKKADTAIAAPGRSTAFVRGDPLPDGCTHLSLSRSGIDRGYCVALVPLGGAGLATAFLGVAAGALAAPFLPATRVEEFEFYLSDLAVRALIVERGSQSPAREVAARLGILVIELEPQPENGAGAFSLSPSSGSVSSGRGGGERECRAGGRLRTSAYLGHHVSAQARAALSMQYYGLGAEHRPDAAADPRGPRPERHAPFSYSRTHGRPARAARCRRDGLLHARVQRPSILRMDGRGPAHLVHGRADHASDDLARAGA